MTSRKASMEIRRLDDLGPPMMVPVSVQHSVGAASRAMSAMSGAGGLHELPTHDQVLLAVGLGAGIGQRVGIEKGSAVAAVGGTACGQTTGAPTHREKAQGSTMRPRSSVMWYARDRATRGVPSIRVAGAPLVSNEVQSKNTSVLHKSLTVPRSVLIRGSMPDAPHITLAPSQMERQFNGTAHVHPRVKNIANKLPEPMQRSASVAGSTAG